MNNSMFVQTAHQDDLAPIMISLLGSFRLKIYDNQVPINSGSKSELLLTYLALTRQYRLERTQILEQLWPGYDVTLAGQSLNSLIYQLNKLTKKFSKRDSLVNHDNGYYYLNTSEEIGIDIDYFDAWRAEGARLLHQGDHEKGITFYEDALTLYKGDLGGDSSIQTIIERERLRAAFLDLLASLSDYAYSEEDYTKALAYIHRLLKHDPCREDAHRQAMRCYVRLGIRTQALRQYQLCDQILAAEFDIKPELATQELFDQIRLDPTNV
ncbi:MAG: bacterial transcriptional activator domain-containing protein [Anaerolineae bacterium]|nr:bacterial transcriptional activator domain-containing protein [Anaerolineae bacterium]